MYSTLGPMSVWLLTCRFVYNCTEEYIFVGVAVGFLFLVRDSVEVLKSGRTGAEDDEML